MFQERGGQELTERQWEEVVEVEVEVEAVVGEEAEELQLEWISPPVHGTPPCSLAPVAV